MDGEQGPQAASALSVGELEELIMAGALCSCPLAPVPVGSDCVLRPDQPFDTASVARSRSLRLGREGLAVGSCVSHGPAAVNSGCTGQQVRCCHSVHVRNTFLDPSRSFEC